MRDGASDDIPKDGGRVRSLTKSVSRSNCKIFSFRSNVLLHLMVT